MSSAKWISGKAQVCYLAVVRKNCLHVCWENKNQCVYMVLHNRAMWPFGKHGPPMCLFRGPRPNTEVYIPDKKKKKNTEGMRGKRKEGRINQAWRKTKATGQRGLKCHLAPTRGKKRELGGWWESRVYQRKVFLLFLDSWVSYYGIRFTRAPLGMWKRGLVVNGSKGWRMMWVGRWGVGVGLAVGWGAVRWC